MSQSNEATKRVLVVGRVIRSPGETAVDISADAGDGLIHDHQVHVDCYESCPRWPLVINLENEWNALSDRTDDDPYELGRGITGN